MRADKINAFGDELHAALVARVPVEPLTSRELDLAMANACRIQLRMVHRFLDAGETVVGKKIGASRPVPPAHLSADPHRPVL